MTTLPSPAADAANRAWRTFAQGLLLDVIAAVVAVLAVSIGDVEWTQTYWYALGGLLAKTVLTSAVAYLARQFVPPTR